jgi:endonuclease-8
LRPKDWPVAIHAVREYCEDFYRWKKKFELRRHWQVYKKHKCPLCAQKITREKLGKFERSTFYCELHQKKLKRGAKVLLHEVLPIVPKGQKELRIDH